MNLLLRRIFLTFLLAALSTAQAEDADAVISRTVTFDGDTYEVQVLHPGTSQDLQRYLRRNFSQEGQFDGVGYYTKVRSLDGSPVYSEEVYEVSGVFGGHYVRQLEVGEIEALRGREMAKGRTLRGLGDSFLIAGTQVQREIDSHPMGGFLTALSGGAVEPLYKDLRKSSSRKDLCKAVSGKRTAITTSLAHAEGTTMLLACFLYAAANVSDGLPTVADASRADEAANAEARNRLTTDGGSNLGSIGETTLQGRDAHGYVHFTPGQVQQIDGGEVEIERTAFWIDSEEGVLLKTRSEGVMRRGNEEKPIFLERENSDFRAVPNSQMYMPYRETMRMGGVLNDSERAQMAEAQAKLAEFEQRMAEMPAAQRAMMQRMMGGQVEQMRSMVESGSLEVVFVTKEIVANPDFGQDNLAKSTSRLIADESLVILVQQNLAALGYDPGNTDGALTAKTTAAISAFQSDAGLPETGEVTRALYDATQSAVERLP